MKMKMEVHHELKYKSKFNKITSNKIEIKDDKKVKIMKHIVIYRIPILKKYKNLERLIEI